MLRLRMLEDAAVVTNAGTPHGFVMFQKVAIRVAVGADSSARLVEHDVGPPRFSSAEAETQWHALGSPPLNTHAGPQVETYRAGEFGFLPSAGSPLTVADAKSLSGPPRRIETEVAKQSVSPPRSVPGAWLLRQYGYLLGWAPLGRAARRAVGDAMLSLPGIHPCGPLKDLIGRMGDALCMRDHELQVIVIVGPKTEHVLGVELELRRRTAYYPDLAAGRIVEAEAFLAS